MIYCYTLTNQHGNLWKYAYFYDKSLAYLAFWTCVSSLAKVFSRNENLTGVKQLFHPSL